LMPAYQWLDANTPGNAGLQNWSQKKQWKS
jgi:hypothetical protein